MVNPTLDPAAVPSTPSFSSDLKHIDTPVSGLAYSIVSNVRWAKNQISYSFPTHDAHWSPNAYTEYQYGHPGEEPWSPDYMPISLSNRSDFEHALRQWENVADIQFILVDETQNNIGDIRIAYTDISDMRITEAWTYLPTPNVRSGDIWVNKSSNSARKEWTKGSFSFLTMLHEIGHTLGLEHPFEDSDFPVHEDCMSLTIMSYSAIAGNQRSFFDYYPTTPMPLDIQAIQYMYGANMHFHKGDDIHHYSDDATYHETLWDSGGIDTINYTGTPPAFIQLQAGKGSFIGKPVHALNATENIPIPNVWIAYDTIIENASGSRHDDILYGNNFDNILTGNDGNDTFMGMAGNDTFLGGAGIDKVLFRAYS